jgi:hypothetical protein
VVAVLVAGIAGAIFFLANFVGPNTREMTIRIPASKFERAP